MRINWKSIIGSVAPTLATALGGPLAGAATRAISAAVLGKPGGSEKEIEQALELADPAVFERVKKADQEFEVKMRELDINLEDIAQKDRDSARKMQMEARSKAPGRIAAMAYGGFFLVLLGLGFIDFKENVMNALLIMLGALTAMVLDITRFYFGSSAGSQEKNSMIEKLLEK